MWMLVLTVFVLLPSSSEPKFSSSHSQPDEDLSHPTELDPHPQVNVSVPVGASVRLHCTVKNVESQAVSWIRLSDYKILTNGLKTFTTDRRLSLLHSDGGDEWTLQISAVNTKDQGGYQCQAATHTGVKTLSSWLWVNKPSASILGSREKHVNIGHNVTIICQLSNSVTVPEFVYWYHNNHVINNKEGVTVITSAEYPDKNSPWLDPPNTTVSKITIKQTSQEHAGNYTCKPSNAQSDSIMLSVTKEPPPGQMCRGSQYDGQRCCTPDNPCGEGEGDCDGPLEGEKNDGHRGCKGDLVCGRNNCKKFGSYYHHEDDCCEKPSKSKSGQEWNVWSWWIERLYYQLIPFNQRDRMVHRYPGWLEVLGVVCFLKVFKLI